MSTMKFKSQIAPKGLQFNSSDFFISDKYATLLTVVSYPKFISPGYLSNLTTMPGIKVVIKHIPVPFSTISKMLNKQISELKTNYQKPIRLMTTLQIIKHCLPMKKIMEMFRFSHIRLIQMHHGWKNLLGIYSEQ